MRLKPHADSNRRRWQAQYSAATNRSFVSGERWTVTNKPESELIIALALLRKNAPWLGKIFILTARPQVPRGLPNFASPPAVVVVHHDEIGFTEPTFNSLAIETSLHRIPGLKERFVYLNDDFFIRRPVYPSTFFANSLQEPARLTRPIFRGDRRNNFNMDTRCTGEKFDSKNHTSCFHFNTWCRMMSRTMNVVGAVAPFKTMSHSPQV